MATRPRESTASRLVRAQAVIEAFRLAPDGRLVFVKRIVDGERYRSHLWVIPWRGGRAQQVTRGAVRDGSPAISPDGTRIAFIRTPVADGVAKAQVWLLPLDGGAAEKLTSMAEGVGSVHWSPDGKRLALVAEAGEPRFVVGRERKRRAATARRITRLDFRDDESGPVGRRSHLWLVAARGRARPRQLTRGDFDVTHPAWSPDGTRIAFAADRTPDATIAPRTQIWSVSIGGDVRKLASLPGDADYPAWSPDGRRLAFIGTDTSDPADHVLQRVWVSEDGRLECLTPDLDLAVGGWAWCDLALAEDRPGPLWLDDRSVVVLIGGRARNIPYRVGFDRTPEPLLDADARLAAAGLDLANGRLALSAAVDGRSVELHAVDHRRLRRIGTDGGSWQRPFGGDLHFEELEVEGPGGAIQVWLASPADAGRRRLPTILHLHGGPTGAWAPGGTMDAILLTNAGYRVAMPNPRGSATFGAGWIEALAGNWGDVDAADALAVVDALVARRLADPRRLGVMGLSYGGFLTQWLIGVTDRFAAAVAENGVANQVSAWANSYFGVHYNRRAGLADPLSDEGMRRLWRSSPLRNAAAIRTPLLMLQAEEDRICPAADSEQLFTALKVLGREVEYVLYPEEHHEMKNYGRPDRRIDRMERMLGWFDRFLGG
ncbi:MAG: prolyl oligopeptidase family serine peptidase [Chloroflexota bacterium]